MIRALLRRALHRIAGGRVPAAPPTGRAPPTHREGWRGGPPPAAAPPTASEAAPEPEVELSAEAAVARAAAGEDIVLLDIREPHELRGGYAVGSWLMPMNSVPERLHELPRDRPLLVICAAGARSFSVAHYLRQQGFAEAWSLQEGVGAYLTLSRAALFLRPEAPIRPLQAAQLRPEGAAALGLPADRCGWPGQVEAAEPVDGEWRYALRLTAPLGGSLRLDGLRAEQVEATPTGPTGGARPSRR